MLELKNICKDYPAGDGTVHALREVSLKFRRSEFVSILGPSGCGKTTMLNIIGGLDQYTSGDLVIGGRSTKDFRARDWDAYRNHSIGFVFQSYNLIPHQTVLQNVELALTLSGVKRGERRRRAIEALERVGLGDQLKKKPGQMSGGQMQRVAIARALVNNPEIILADEPTGALDTETSVQVMDTLKEISRDRLVIMVTHNPDLADTYSTRIINMLDGRIVGDSQPVSDEEIASMERPEPKKKREKMPAMRLPTSFSLSLKNLISKKGRTMLTSFAGSIGIIGIALIFAVSQGMTSYIDTLQEDTLASYPLTLQAQHMDMGSLLTNFIGSATSGEPHEKDAVYSKAMIGNLVNALGSMDETENDLAAFKVYLEDQMTQSAEEGNLSGAVTGIQYTYDAPLLVYTENVDGSIIQSDAQALMEDLLIQYFDLDMSSMMSMSESYGVSAESMMPGFTVWQEMLSGNDGAVINPILEKQYDLIYGTWPNSYDEIVLVVDEENEIADMTLYALGLKSEADVDALAQAAFNKQAVEISDDRWTYEEICALEYRVILGSDCYAYDEATGTYVDLRETETGLKYLYDNGLSLKVTGILRPNEDAVSGMLSGSIGYTSLLTEYIVDHAGDAPAVQAQLADPATDIFTGLPFRENTGTLTSAQKAEEFDNYMAAQNEAGLAEAYVAIMSLPPEELVANTVAQTLGGMTRQEMETTLVQTLVQQMKVSEEDVANYIFQMTDEELQEIFASMIAEQVRGEYAANVQAELLPLGQAQLAAMMAQSLPTYTEEQRATYHDQVLTFSESTYEENLIELGYVDLDDPASINLYASSFESKDIIENTIADYNASVTELEQIEYTDYIGLMMSSVTSIIDAVTYVLIAFVAISLVVSSIMIGVITLISVQERTKEIGILRAIGASKRNVSTLFTAETVMIGFAAGLLGVVVTYLLCIPINAIIYHFTGIGGLQAFLPVDAALILIVISVVLTLVAGIIPARSAAKKDPAVALRSE